MSGKSSKTTLVTLRLDNEVVCTLRRRIHGRRTRWGSVGEYLEERVTYDTLRSHNKKGE